MSARTNSLLGNVFYVRYDAWIFAKEWAHGEIDVWNGQEQGTPLNEEGIVE